MQHGISCLKRTGGKYEAEWTAKAEIKNANFLAEAEACVLSNLDSMLNTQEIKRTLFN